jgi:16S rRNA (guanine527-N7)-methyltransferase
MQEILKYFPDLNTHQRKLFLSLNEIFRTWNQKINLISRKDIDSFYLKHVLHSLAIAKFVEFTPKTKVLDVGTGGGFPGIPLAIFFPQCDFILVDSIEKKINVVQDIINQLELKNCKTKVIRAEKINEKFDFVVSRAVAPMPKLYNWTKNNVSKHSANVIPNGIICLKGGDLSEELEMFENWYTTTHINQYFNDDFFETKKIIHLFKF